MTFSHKNLKWIDGQIVESQGILRVVPLMMGNNRIYLDFHIFDIPEGVEFVLVGRPIVPLVNPTEIEPRSRLRLAKNLSRSA